LLKNIRLRSFQNTVEGRDLEGFLLAMRDLELQVDFSAEQLRGAFLDLDWGLLRLILCLWMPPTSRHTILIEWDGKLLSCAHPDPTAMAKS
jgi:hypothetical protein